MTGPAYQPHKKINTTQNVIIKFILCAAADIPHEICYRVQLSKTAGW